MAKDWRFGKRLLFFEACEDEQEIWRNIEIECLSLSFENIENGKWNVINVLNEKHLSIMLKRDHGDKRFPFIFYKPEK